MPRRLPERCGPDCILGFLAAAEYRYVDGVRLSEAGRRTAAIYLWGYAAEMLLKAGCFRALDYDPERQITAADLRAATRGRAESIGYVWPNGANWHNLPAWANLLVRIRTQLSPHSFPTPAFAGQLVTRAVRVYQVWRETLRYHHNIAYEFEVETVRGGVAWFVEHAAQL